MSRAIVIIEADPHDSRRALEALRSAVGLALADNPVEVFLSGPAQRLLNSQTSVFPGSREAAASLDALEGLGAKVSLGAPTFARLRDAEAVIRWGA